MGMTLTKNSKGKKNCTIFLLFHFSYNFFFIYFLSFFIFRFIFHFEFNFSFSVSSSGFAVVSRLTPGGSAQKLGVLTGTLHV